MGLPILEKCYPKMPAVLWRVGVSDQRNWHAARIAAFERGLLWTTGDRIAGQDQTMKTRRIFLGTITLSDLPYNLFGRGATLSVV